MNNFIRELMEECELKQKDLAEIIGVSPAAVSKWNDLREMSVENLFSLSKLFHITVDELLNEKRAKESLEDKWRREYSINEVAARNAMIDRDKEALLKCLETVAKANDRFFMLFVRKITNRITSNESKEWEFIKQFFDINIRRSHLFDEVIRLPKDNRDEFILDFLSKKYGEDEKTAIMWEIKKIYKIGYFDIDQSILDDFDDIFYAWYQIQTPIEKDDIINEEYNKNKRIDILYELIKRGGNILYRPEDLNLTNYDLKDLDDFEGEIKPIPELEAAQAVIYELYDNYSFAMYEQYQALINRDEMECIKMEAKYKEKDPIRYWEFIKAR
ncbi:MAG: helix-turn-helix domain-containing protein [Muribaculaceae bacterium]|nr:helix-turn-helix domain-containing protein [Muribaculaceae bacterium]